MLRLLLIALLAPLLPATIKLYLKDGDYHIVREYQVLEDRVRYYSTERGEWEDIPLELVDLKRTEREIQRAAEKEKEAARLIDEEERAIRAAREEAARVPQEPGAYYVDGKQLKPLKAAETKLSTSRKRTLLQWMTPIPVITGKATLELDGETSSFSVPTGRPEFYIRLSAAEGFGIIRLTPAKGIRVVEKITVVPVSKEMIEERQMVEVFRRQVGENLYKIWPIDPIGAGEYAVVEYTEGKVNIQVWDFTAKPPQ